MCLLWPILKKIQLWNKLLRMWLLINQYDGLTWQINIGGPIASLMFERANASTMKRSFFSLGVLLLGKHGQQATRKWQSEGNSPTTVTTHHTEFHFIQALLVLKNYHRRALTFRDVFGKYGIYVKNQKEKNNVILNQPHVTVVLHLNI